MKRKFLLLASVAAAAIAIAACGKKDAKTEKPAAETAETTGEIKPVADSKLAEENKAEGEKFLAANGAKEGVKTTPSGLQYEVLNDSAEGATPGDSDIVDMHYVATKIDGVEFDSSRARGAAARFPVSSVAGSWTEEGVKLMNVGDRYRFYVPSKLAFGEEGTPGGPIGPNEALIYEVELLKVTNADKNSKAAADFLAENAKKPGVKTTESGLQYEVISEGPADGKSPADTNIVKVHYKGTLLDGTEFDSSYARNAPAEFPLGEVIAGWTEGVQLMSVGDKFRFYVPPQLAYGETGRPGSPIGPNEALIFEVELLEVK
jgi:peptidylprolyl isomerase